MAVAEHAPTHRPNPGEVERERNHSTLFHFRELNQPEDFLAYFRLRHRVYCLEGYLAACPMGLDLDPFDATSRFVGAFQDGCLVAGARMILAGEGPHRQALQEMTEVGQLPPTGGTGGRTYHSQDIFDMRAIFHYCQEEGRGLVEFGRTVVLPELRKTGLGITLVNALYGLALQHGIELGFAAVPPKLRGFYQKAGCRILEGKGVGSKEGISTELMGLVVDLQRLGGVFRATYRAHRHLSRYGSWVVCSEPGCLEQHRHFPEPRERLSSVTERLPAVQVHGWEPALQRLPLLREELQLHDVSLRDALQSASVREPSLEAKIEFLDRLVELGIDTADLGLPGAGGRMQQHCQVLVSEVARRRMPLAITCAGRTLAQDVVAISRISQQAGLAVEAALHLDCSPLRQICQPWDLEQLLWLTRKAVTLAVREGLSVMFVTEDATRTSSDILEPLFHVAIQAGARAVCLSDTAGYANPQGTSRLVRFVAEFAARHNYPVRLDWHGHNDRGLALANCLAAIEAGVDRVHATVLGVGERAGNASMERILLQLHRLSGRPLKLPALAGYLGWASRQLEVMLPADLLGLLSRPKEVRDEIAVA